MKTGKEKTYMKTEETQKNKIDKRIEQSNEITKTKTRRSKMIKNASANFTIFYQNTRGYSVMIDQETMESLC